jgi:hypothetical protein
MGKGRVLPRRSSVLHGRNGAVAAAVATVAAGVATVADLGLLVAALATRLATLLVAAALATPAPVALAGRLPTRLAHAGRGRALAGVWSSRRWLCRGDEGRGRRRRPSVDVDFLEQEVGARLGERRERAMHLQDRHHVAILATEATQESEHHLAIADGVAEFGEGRRHGL